MALRVKRSWVFVINSDFLIPASLQPNVVDLRYFKLWIALHQIILVWNIKSLQLNIRFLRYREKKIWFVAKTQFLYELHAVADLKILYSIIELNSRVSSLGSSHLCRCMYIKKKNTIIKLTINIMFLDKDMEISRKLPHPFVKSGFRYCRARNLKEYRWMKLPSFHFGVLTFK